MKRVLIVTENFYPEEFKINEIALEFKSKGYLVDVLTLNPTYPFGRIFSGFKNKIVSKDKYKDITVYRVRAVTGYKNSKIKKILKYVNFMFLGSMFALFRGKRYDYVFGFGVGALTGMVPAAIINKIYKKNVTLWIQDIWPDSVFAYGFKKTKIKVWFLEKLVRFVYKNSTNIAVSGLGFKEKILPYCDKNRKISFYPNWPESLDADTEAYNFSDTEKIHFTFAGNIGKVQNLENILLAYGALDKDVLKKIQLNIIGDGSNLIDLKKIVSKNNISGVIFHGKKERAVMSKYYNGSDYLIISLIDEPIFSLTIPSKLQTYIAAKKPIFAIIKGETKKIVLDYNLGISAEPHNIADIQRGFKELLNLDKSQKKKYTNNSIKLIEKDFNKSKIIDGLEDLMKGLE